MLQITGQINRHVDLNEINIYRTEGRAADEGAYEIFCLEKDAWHCGKVTLLLEEEGQSFRWRR